MQDTPAPEPTPSEPTEAALDRRLFTTLTPGFIISSLSPDRAREVATLFEEATHAGESPAQSAAAATLALLRVLRVEELRRVAAKAGLATEGDFHDLYRRLALLC